MTTPQLKQALSAAMEELPDCDIVIVVREKASDGTLTSLVHNVGGRANAVEMLRETISRMKEKDFSE